MIKVFLSHRVRVVALAIILTLTSTTGVLAASSATSDNRSARVATGQEVKVAKSKYSDSELAAKRPDYADLIPKKR